jgi:hypothetical protein
VLIVSPLHSVTTPTVGVGYLASALKAEGIECPIVDLNIRLRQRLQENHVSQSWLEWIFPYGERTFGGELLLSQACFDRPVDDMLEYANTIETSSFRDFFQRLAPGPRLQSTEAARIRCLIRTYLEESAQEIAQVATHWLGFSVVVTNQLAVIFLLRRIHQLRPDLRMVLGGPHFNRDNARPWIRAFPEIDAVIVGEARSALTSWINGNEQDHQNQIVRREDPHIPIVMAPKQTKQWLPADWSNINWNDYLNVTEDLQPSRRSEGAAIPIMGARGCSYNRCTFCYEVLLAPIYQARSVEHVADEICQQERLTGQSDFFLTDLDLNSDYQRTLDLARIIKQRAPAIRFHCWLRAHELDEDILAALYDAGARSWFVGIEAVTDNLLSLMRKGYDGQHAQNVIALMARFAERKTDLRYAFNLIPNYPGETVDDVRTTFDIIRESRSHYYGCTGALYEFTLTVNSIAWINRHKMGLRNLVGWNSVILPSDLRDQLPSHVYWYEREDETEAKRRLMWDHIRVLIGHEPHYIRVGITGQ